MTPKNEPKKPSRLFGRIFTRPPSTSDHPSDQPDSDLTWLLITGFALAALIFALGLWKAGELIWWAIHHLNF
jgi:hypothetical protein